MYRFFSRQWMRLFIFCSCFFITQNVSAWGLIGHRVVAEIAQRHLSANAKKELFKLLGNETLAWWANWPDFIKSDSSWNFVSKWHFVDLPGNINKADFIVGLKKLEGKNLYTQIQEMAAQVKDKNLKVEKRQIALRFLIHLIGDLHQPLHVGRSEDQGGNKISVNWFDNKTNLHSVWDEKLISFQQYSYTEYAKLLDIAGKDQEAKWVSGRLEDWFYESHVLSDKIYLQSPENANLGFKYNYLFQKDLNTQLLKGGLRLAKVLNDLFK